MKNSLFPLLVSFLLVAFNSKAQILGNDSVDISVNLPDLDTEYVSPKAFHGTRIINGHSVETLPNGYL